MSAPLQGIFSTQPKDQLLHYSWRAFGLWFFVGQQADASRRGGGFENALCRSPFFAVDLSVRVAQCIALLPSYATVLPHMKGSLAAEYKT